jgi:alpha-N-arabinofuranosidase
MNRREFLASAAISSSAIAQLRSVAAAQLEDAKSSGASVVIDPTPTFELSPYLNMQFMEPLGTTDSSVEAAWDYNRDDWRQDFVKVTRELAPGMLRFGGLFSRYYKWREGIGPADKRPWMRNYVWGGKETNRVGTQEFVDFCRRVGGSEPLYCVNFLSDGEKRYGPERTGDAQEAADWVSYANDPENRERKGNGVAAPFGIKFWQLGNETSYGGKSTFSKDESIAATIAFAKAMRERDPSIQLIGWGDNDWAPDLLTRAGEHLQYVAIHMMNQSPVRKDTALRGLKYQFAPEQAWEELMEMIPERIEKKLNHLEETLPNSPMGLAITEGHVSFAPHNSNPILLEWLTGVYHARAMNVYQRHGARVKIATIADFNGTRWTNCAVLHQVPGGVSYLTPAGSVARLFKPLKSERAVRIESAPADLDITASTVGSRIRLRVANMRYNGSTDTSFAIKNRAIAGGRVFEIAPENPRQEVSPLNPEVFAPREKSLDGGALYRFPARSVSVVELDVKNA